MIPIRKKKKPQELVAYCRQKNAKYDEMPKDVKMAVRQSLITEQGYLCAYCMQRIQDVDFDTVHPKASIERWRVQSKTPEASLDYGNMLAVCRSEGLPKAEQTCDVARGDKDLKWNPANPDHALSMRISYSRDGSISSDDKEFDQQLNEVLHLNLNRLKDNRKAVWKGIERIKKKDGSSRKLKQLKEKYSTDVSKNSTLEPFCGFVDFFFDEKIETVFSPSAPKFFLKKWRNGIFLCKLEKKIFTASRLL